MSLQYNNPQKYMGNYEKCYIGYAKDEGLREHAASGGIVTSILVNLLKKGDIQGAFVSRQEMIDGKVSALSFIATTEEELLNARTSIYTDFPLVKYFKDILCFNGKLAVVALPCQMYALTKFIEKHPEIKEKIYLKISLFCSGNPGEELILDIMKKNKVPLEDVKKVYFRKGHWRGRTAVEMKDGSNREFSYLYNICTYKNLYFNFMPRCFSCSDHFGYESDFSCGDVWLKEMKENPIKHTGFVAKSKRALEIVENMVDEGLIHVEEITPQKVLKSQKRALIFKFNTAKPRKKFGKLFGQQYNGSVDDKYKINHLLAALLIMLNIKASNNKAIRRILFKMPRKLMFFYMGFIRVLLNH